MSWFQKMATGGLLIGASALVGSIAYINLTQPAPTGKLADEIRLKRKLNELEKLKFSEITSETLALRDGYIEQVNGLNISNAERAAYGDILIKHSEVPSYILGGGLLVGGISGVGLMIRRASNG